jgi:hypothetical protein
MAMATSWQRYHDPRQLWLAVVEMLPLMPYVVAWSAPVTTSTRPPTTEVVSLVLPITRVLMALGAPLRLASPQGVLFPWEMVHCRLGATLSVKACLDHRTDLWPSGGRRGATKHPECTGCPLGAGYAVRAAWHAPRKPSQPRDVMTYEQRVARERWVGIHGAGPGRMDPMAEAAMLTPDDAVL